jgi:hypothetical protein
MKTTPEERLIIFDQRGSNVIADLSRKKIKDHKVLEMGDKIREEECYIPVEHTRRPPTKNLDLKFQQLLPTNLPLTLLHPR